MDQKAVISGNCDNHNGATRSAFSLLELSIILVVSGLLLIGFIKSREVLNSAGLFKVMTEINSYRAAIGTYHIAYGYYPGDDPNATSNLTTVADGSGDGNINWSSESDNADLAIIETGLMQLPLEGVFRVSAFKHNLYHPPVTCSTLSLSDIGVNCHQLGSSTDPNNAGFVPKEHYRIDRKLDDGIALAGKIRFRVYGDVSTATCADSGGYVFSNELAGCNLTYDITVD